jgi:PIN domain nuclease of toxin-antitoxin system
LRCCSHTGSDSTGPNLSEREARDLIANLANEVIVSAATVWEISTKRSLRKLTAPDGLAAALVQAGTSFAE